MLAVQEGDGLGVENEGWISTGEDESRVSLRFQALAQAGDANSVLCE